MWRLVVFIIAILSSPTMACYKEVQIDNELDTRKGFLCYNVLKYYLIIIHYHTTYIIFISEVPSALIWCWWCGEGEILICIIPHWRILERVILGRRTIEMLRWFWKLMQLLRTLQNAIHTIVQVPIYHIFSWIQVQDLPPPVNLS